MKKLVLLILMMLPVAVSAQINWLDEPGREVTDNSFKVMQTITEQKALAYGKSSYGSYYGQLYLILYDNEEDPMYDGMILDVPHKKEARVVGTYRYETRAGYQKTVPVIRFFDKKSKKKERWEKETDEL